MSTHRDLRKAETAVLELATGFIASAARPLATNLRRMSVSADHYYELAEACRDLHALRLDLDGDAAHNRTDTSVLASKLPGKTTLRRQVLQCLVLGYEYHKGMTTEAVENRLGRKHTSVSSAMNYLANHGLVFDSGLRRDTTSNTPAIVYAPTEIAVKLVRESAFET